MNKIKAIGRKASITSGFAACLVAGLSLVAPAEAQQFFRQSPLPEFTSKHEQEWINSSPLKKSHLEGKVTLVYFWAYECWNSYRSFPWLRSVEKRFAKQGFQVLGVHTPEFEREKNRKSLERKVEEFQLEHPVMMDNDFKYWRKMNNRYWPAFYLVDRDGKIVHKMIGETHIGQRRAKAFEQVVAELVAK